jgi:hypothetical protein
MNITKAMKQDAIESAMRAIFSKRTAALCKKTQAFIERCHDEKYGEQPRNITSFIDSWLQHGLRKAVMVKH